MAEMNAVSRFFVNTFEARRNARLYRWLAANLALPAGAVCLEVGCGNGSMAARIVDGMGPARYVATDLDLHQIETAQRHLDEHYPQGVPPRLELRPADMLALPFPDSSFDVVFAFVSLHHAGSDHHDFAGMQRALAEVDRVLRPGGIFAYQELMNKDRVRAWLMERGYRLEASARGWTRDSAIFVKGAGPGPAAKP